MDEVKIGKVAYKVLKMIAKERFKLGDLSDSAKMREMIAEMRNHLDVPENDLVDFAKILMLDLLEDAEKSVLNLAH